MALRLGDTAPDFTAPTTHGDINFRNWQGDSWVVLFSHPKDYTPVCTTELGMTAKLGDEFAARNVKAIAVSVDTVEDHRNIAGEARDFAGFEINDRDAIAIVTDVEFGVVCVGGEPLRRAECVGRDKGLKLNISLTG